MLVSWAALACVLPAYATETRLACAEPSVAADGSDVFVACGRGTAILVGRGTPERLGPLDTIGTLGGLALGHHRGPKIAVSGATVVVSAIGKGEGRSGADLWAWRSSDHGDTWSGPVRVTDTADAAQEGLHGMAVSGSTVAVTWLDVRAGRMRLYGSRSGDGGASWSANNEIYRSPGGAICTCCHPSVLVAADGTLTTLFRNDVDGNRDMYLKDGDAPPVRLGDRSWRLSACPMDGGGLARTRDGRVITAWRRDQQVLVASPGHPERIVGGGKDPALAIAGDVPVVAWQSPTGLVLRFGSAPVIELDPAGRAPALAPLSDGSVVVAWQRGEESVVTRVSVGQDRGAAPRVSRRGRGATGDRAAR
jgi:hypothetical protein